MYAGSTNLITAALLATAFGCSGAIGGNNGDDDPPGGGGAGGTGVGGMGGRVDEPTGSCNEAAPGNSPLRRLTRDEYNATIRVLLNDRRDVGNTLPDDDHGEDLYQAASSLIVSPVWAEQAWRAADDLSVSAASPASLTPLLPCKVATDGEEPCAIKFIQTFGKRAFRRPLATDEVGRLLNIYKIARTDTTFEHGIQLVIRAILVSPHFLYRVEVGAPDKSVVRLSQYEIASRLSYFLWGSMPDATLFTAADMGQLGTAAQIGAQAKRMLGDGRAKALLVTYHQRWAGYELLDEVDKDLRKYPTFTRLLQPMKNESRYFLDDVLWKRDGRLETLLTLPVAWVNTSLAPHYGVTPPTDEAFHSAPLDPVKRSGFLTTAGFLSAHTSADTSAAIHRGKFVRERLLCTTPPDPPPDLMVVPPVPKAGVTNRDRLRMHSEVAACRGCHTLMDPIGFGFEHYDAIGRWRDTDAAKAVDASGVLTGSDVDGTFSGVPDLARKLSASDQVRECVVRNLVGYAQGPEAAGDACTLRKVKQAFAASNYDIRTILTAITQTDAFQLRRPLPGEVSP